MHSDPADPNKPATTTLTWHRGFDFTVVPQTPGIYRVSVNGVSVVAGEVYDYSGNGPNVSCQVKRKDKGHCLRELESLKDGDTVTVTAEHATGPVAGRAALGVPGPFSAGLTHGRPLPGSGSPFTEAVPLGAASVVIPTGPPDRQGANSQAAGRLVARLESADLLERYLCDTDRRGAYTQITLAGRAVQAAAATYDDVLRGVL
ncbi:hypothetical protein [Micromonospora sp. CB01531]|uniref:hypothetical protein n=1 Tax=Micromonospora sp. CB01531 TaxID=1718947 RepID=UPI00093A85ED|nr:hypothetical protein [Micromonospora sp. CB01531]OKI41686.1 hypothetical protein A6A27_39130 [Micromonospora sp. CB01531]